MSNVGTIDRNIRFLLGVALLIAPFLPAFASLLAGFGDWKYAIALIGVVMIATAVFRFCPAYVLFGFRRRPAPKI